MKQPCLRCNKLTSNPKYCSLHCANSMPRTPKPQNFKKCLECEKDFTSTASAAQFCSRSCSATHNNRKFPKRGTDKKIGICLYCNVKLKNVRAKFCSENHSILWKTERKISTWLAGNFHPPSISPNSIYRRYLYEQQGDVCALCPTNKTWYGQELNFVLDHIDGNSTDSSRSNVRLICPNCDSQLPTYKARNKGKGRFARRQRYLEGKSF